MKHKHGNFHTKIKRVSKDENKWYLPFLEHSPSPYFTKSSLFKGNIWTPFPSSFLGELKKRKPFFIRGCSNYEMYGREQTLCAYHVILISSYWCKPADFARLLSDFLWVIVFCCSSLPNKRRISLVWICTSSLYVCHVLLTFD